MIFIHDENTSNNEGRKKRKTRAFFKNANLFEDKKKNSRENYFRQLFATNENCIENESRCCGQPFDRAVNSFFARNIIESKN